MDRDKFGQLILRRVIKIVATRCHILRLICTEFYFGWGSRSDPDPAGKAYSVPPNPVAGFNRPTSNTGRKGGQRRGGKGRRGKEGSREGVERYENGQSPSNIFPKSAPMILCNKWSKKLTRGSDRRGGFVAVWKM